MTNQVKGIVAKLLAKLASANTFSEENTFSSGIKLGSGMVLSNDSESQNLIRTNAGIYSAYTSSLPTIIYGFAANVFRSGGASTYTVAAQLSAFANNSAVSGGTFGCATEAWNKPTASTDLVGLESSIVNETSSATAAKIGLNIVFKNRPDAQADITGSLGTNNYNRNSIGLWISSQVRSGKGEYCGWRWGIRFANGSLDRDAFGTAVGIDFCDLEYTGTPGPLTAYAMTAAIRMRPDMSILWNGDPSGGNPTDPTFPIRTYFDFATSKWKLTNTTTDLFTVDVGTGNVELKYGSTIRPNVRVFVTALNSWVPFGVGTHTLPGYQIDKLGNVRLYGELKDGIIPETIFILPPEYRPLTDQNFPITTNIGAASQHGNLGILRDGTVAINCGSNLYISLDGIVFDPRA